jgi:hypothetical protein
LRRTALAAALIPCALLLTACGSSGSSPIPSASGANAGLTQAQLLARFKTALASTTALHIKGSSTQNGSAFTMDMQINKDGTAQGSIVSEGLTMPLIVAGGVSYVQVTPSLVTVLKSQAAGADASSISKIVTGKWISSKSAIGSSMTQGLDSMTNFGEMTKELASGSGDTFSYLGTATLNGQQVAQYKDVSTSDGTSSTGTLSIPLNGTALPIAESGTSAGNATFTWNQPTKVTAPAASDIIELPAS